MYSPLQLILLLGPIFEFSSHFHPTCVENATSGSVDVDQPEGAPFVCTLDGRHNTETQTQLHIPFYPHIRRYIRTYVHMYKQ